jgi:protease-4
MIQDFYFKFVTKVAENRNQTYEDIDQVARGRVWHGFQGIKINLIDMIGGLDEAVDVAKVLADIDADQEVELIYYPKRRSVFSQYFNYISLITELSLNPLEGIEEYLQKIQMQPLMLMPFILQ